MKERQPAGAERYAGIIRGWRKEKGLNQQQLADQVGVSRNTVAGWETGHSRPDLETLPRLCSSLGISVNAFFGLDDGVTGTERRLLDAFRALEETDRQAVLWQTEALRTQRQLHRAAPIEKRKPSSRAGAPAGGTGSRTMKAVGILREPVSTTPLLRYSPW